MNSSMALARRWRPKNFQSVIGQDHIVKGLSYALNHDRLHHAYLFTGTRGVGKTTLARIFAKCLSCEKGVSAHPCGECGICQQIDQGNFLDLIEIDAASRTKVEDTRELLDNVQYAPTLGRFKIYLIDEVHMLSTHSFNALLKTLEEPPSHVKFLLATTDPQKLPVTVLSRCLQYHLRALRPSELTPYFESILEKESVSFESEAVSLLALQSKGSVRDGLSLLDQAVSFTGAEIRADLVSEMLGSVPEHRIYALAESLVKGEVQTALQIVDELQQGWINFSALLNELARFWQECALIQQGVVSVSDHFELSALKNVAHQMDALKTQLFYEMTLNAQKQLDLAPDPFSGFQMMVLRLLSFSALPPRTWFDLEADSTPVHFVENEKISPPKPLPKTPIPENKIPPKEPILPSSKQEASVPFSSNWGEMIQSLKLEGILRQVASHMSLKSMEPSSEGYRIQLLAERKIENLLSERITHRLCQSLEKGLKSKVRLDIQLSENDIETTPAQEQAKKVLNQKRATQKVLDSDECLSELREAFGAEVQSESVETIKKETVKNG